VRAAIELIDNLEDRFLAFHRRRVSGEQHTDAQVSRGALLLRDQRVRGFLHTVVQESIRIVSTEDEARPHGMPEMVVHLPGLAWIRHPQHLELCTVSHAGELLERLPGFYRQAIQLPDHQFDDVVGEAHGVNAAKVPDPTAFAIIECEQALVCECRDELNREERVAASLFVNQFRQRGGAFRFAVKGVRQQLPQIVAPERGEHDVLHDRTGLTDRIEFVHQRVRGADLIFR